MISVIVPVYNVEKYIRRCVESILAQTYSDLEIILVDDGSTDSSGKICDEYQKDDLRVVVVHKKNGGLSDARNVGLEIAKGEYIGFVDSDDYIEPDMYKILYDNCIKYSADLAAARFIEFNSKGEKTRKLSDNIEVFSRRQMLELFIYGHKKYQVTMSVWDRLYKRELIGDLRFPIGKCYEDIVFSTCVIAKTKVNVYIDQALYHYRLREDSITGEDMGQKQLLPHRIITDLIPQLEERIEFLLEIGEKGLAEECRCQYIHQIMTYIVDYKYDKENVKFLKEKVRNNCRDIRYNSKRDKMISLEIYMLKGSIDFTVVMLTIYKKIKRGLSNLSEKRKYGVWLL